ncbi:MAG: hypothetical protein EAZ30_14780 [Betaproteobacteria bacterium]|nr:MAG: hypothetical protein EAZ30_14780 [Betaproteobacteria bacterium]
MQWTTRPIASTLCTLAMAGWGLLTPPTAAQPVQPPCPILPSLAASAGAQNSGERLTVDGLLLSRYAAGLRGNALVAGSGLQPSNATAVESFIAARTGTSLDWDGDLAFTPRDATLIARRMAGLRGDALAAGLPAGGAPRTTAQVSDFIAGNCYTEGSGYARALQLGLYFYEGQESGALSPGNRVPWRGPSHLDDGADVGRDLSGGWYDAGDHWKSNLTMAYSGAMLALSRINFPLAYQRADQNSALINSLRHVNDYFLKTINDPNPGSTTNFSGYEIAIDIAGKSDDGNPAEPSPNLHSVWTGAELTDGFTVRQTLRVNTTVRGPDVAAAMAASMAGAAWVLHAQGDSSKAATYLTTARKLFAYARAYPFDAASTTSGGFPRALTPSGALFQVGYRAPNATSGLMLAAAMLFQAENTSGLGNAANAAAYLNFATDVISNPTSYGFDATWDVSAWWRETGSGNTMFPALQLWLALQPANTTIQNQASFLRTYLDKWRLASPSQADGYRVTPGGLAYRNSLGDSFLLQNNMNTTAVAAAYGLRSGQTVYYTWAKTQLDYVLGGNPAGRSYVVGYGSNWPKKLHHRGASGSWTGFDGITPGKPGYQEFDRHTLFGAMPGGPKRDDSFADDRTHAHSEPGLNFSPGLIGALAAVVSEESNVGAIDSFLPTPSSNLRNTSTDWATTDREFFAEARLAGSSTTHVSVDLKINNRSRWPARITTTNKLRFFFALNAGTSVGDLTATVSNGPPNVSVGSPTLLRAGIGYVDVDFTGERLSPHFVWQARLVPVTPPKTGSPDTLYVRSATLRLAFASGKGIGLTAHSLAGTSTTNIIQPLIAVYESNTLVGGVVP